jgi:peptidoglycan hydrolase CwlO-like protein
VRAGRKALREAEHRVPPDLRKQLERSIKDGQKTLKTAIVQLQAQVRSRAKQADIDKVLKRLDGLSKQVQQVARGASSRGATTAKRTARPKTRTAAVRKPATRKAATRKPATRKPAPRTAAAARPASTAPATRRAAPRRPSTRRASSAPVEPSTSPAASEPSWMPESNDSGGTST